MIGTVKTPRPIHEKPEKIWQSTTEFSALRSNLKKNGGIIKETDEFYQTHPFNNCTEW